LSDLLEDDSKSVVGTLEDRSVGDIEVGQTGFLEVLGSFESFLSTLLGKGRVLPSMLNWRGGVRKGDGREEERERGSNPVKRLSCCRALSQLELLRKQRYKNTPCSIRIHLDHYQTKDQLNKSGDDGFKQVVDIP